MLRGAVGTARWPQHMDVLSVNPLADRGAQGTAKCAARMGGSFLWVLTCRDKKVPRPRGETRLVTVKPARSATLYVGASTRPTTNGATAHLCIGTNPIANISVTTPKI